MTPREQDHTHPIRHWRRGELAGLLLGAQRLAADAAQLARASRVPGHLQDQLDAHARAAGEAYVAVRRALRPREG